MSIAVDPVVGSTRVIVLAPDSSAVRGTPAEFRHFGLSVVLRGDILLALAEVARDPHAVLVVSSELSCESIVDVFDLALATARSSVLFGNTPTTDLNTLTMGMTAGIRATVDLPLTPERLERALRVLPLVSPETGPITVGALSVDPGLYRLAWDGTPIAVTPREFSIVLELARRYPHVATLDELARGYAGTAVDPHGGVRVAITHVRSRIAAIAGVHSAKIIETVRGVGYRLAS